jgi:hypothetical protein
LVILTVCLLCNEGKSRPAHPGRQPSRRADGPNHIKTQGKTQWQILPLSVRYMSGPIIHLYKIRFFAKMDMKLDPAAGKTVTA